MAHRVDTDARAGGARLLVVEDQVEVLGMLVRKPQSGGHSVQAAGSGDAALELFQSTRDVDLLITDIVMPGSLQGAPWCAR